MKKKLFASKLKFQKTTVVSFNTALNIKGGMLQNSDTRVVSVDGYMCLLTDTCIPAPTIGGCVPTTAIDNTCPPPTTRNDETVFCGATNDATRRDCTISLKGC
ncbi:hypothetical protein U8527_17525 [Kordia algicida OT-1]|uniref:Uncharacterized protein n=1 Tax=Kordia algicida OT-1 TaxID=391587 RepID=A9E3C4_9FLAO|nr:hypothetical protein [Kordia algicida]EDP95492.1 hypothetical protein KAOT1_11231 [Kordia algicida OT-1]